MADDFDPAKVAWVLDSRSLEHLLSAISSATEVVMDLETTGIDEHAVTGGPTNNGVAARVALASLTLPQHEQEASPTTWVLPLSHPSSPFVGRWRSVLRHVCSDIAQGHKPLTNHNVKYDARYEEAATGVDISSQIVWDTQMSAHLLDETISTKLKERAPVTFHVPAWDEFDLTVPGEAERVPLFDLGMYAARDTYWTWRLKNNHRYVMFLEGGGEPFSSDDVANARLGLLATWVAMPMVSTLCAVEQRGFRLDRDWASAELELHTVELDGVRKELAHRYDGNPTAPDPDDVSFAPTSNWFKAWTQTAIAAGDLKIAAMTPTGQPKWDKGVLRRQARAGYPLAQDIIDVRSHIKKAEYLTSWLKHVTPEGLIHTTYNAGRVVTGRLSSEEPNMQQVTSSLKPAFIPREGYYIADLDYSQIELRMAAFVANCKPMLEAFHNKEDLHRLLAAKITGKEPFTVTPFERQAGKSANFGLLYLISPFGFQQYADEVYGVSFTIEEAEVVHALFYDTWTGIAEWHARTIKEARDMGQITSPIGRVRRLPGIHDGSDYMRSFAERQAVNSPIQGFASDLMQTAAASIKGNLPGFKPVREAEIVATVHDDIVVEVPIDRWEEVTRQCIDRMLAVDWVLAKLGVKLTVPLAVEASIGTRWGLADIGVINSDSI